MKFNSRIFTIALIPFYGYLILNAYTMIQSYFQYAIDPLKTLTICMLLIAAAGVSSLSMKRYHLIGSFLYLFTGGIGVYFGLLPESQNWMMLIASAFVIAFGVTLYEMAEHHRELWHEKD